MAFSFEAAKRVLRHEPSVPLRRRPDDQLPFLQSGAVAGGSLLLDTCCYIDQMQGRAPKSLQDLVDIRLVNHSVIAIQELMFTIGVLKQDDERTKKVIEAIELVVRGMPSHRIFVPDPDVMGRAAVYAGMLGRTQGYAKDDKMKALNDCILFLQAGKLGFTFVTANVAEFDILSQIRTDIRVQFYRPISSKTKTP